LENDGGSGTAGSHWESDYLINEMMTGYSTGFDLASLLTLSYFADMGMYSLYLPLEKSYTGIMFYGKGEGSIIFS